MNIKILMEGTKQMAKIEKLILDTVISQKQFEKSQNICAQFKNLDISKISNISTPMLGVTASLKQVQKNMGNQFKNLDISKISTINTPMLGVTASLKQVQKNMGNQFKNLDISKISTVNTPMLGLTASLKQIQKSMGNQFKNLDISKISNISTPMLGIVETMKQFQNNVSKQLADVNFSDIKINTNGTIDYLDETFNIEDVVADVNSYFIPSKSIEQKVNQDTTEYIKKHNIIVNIIICFLLFVQILTIQPELYSFELSVTSTEQQFATTIQDLNKNIQKELDGMIEFLLFLFTLPYKCGVEINDIATKYPGMFQIMTSVIQVILQMIYNIAKKKRESIIFSKEIINDSKRKIKLIKSQLEMSIKDEFKSEMVNGIFHRNFGIVNQKSLNVKTHNTTKSPVIYKLSLGEIVIIIEKNQEWTNIQFIGKDDNNYIGWVSSRSIDKYDKE